MKEESAYREIISKFVFLLITKNQYRKFFLHNKLTKRE
nr:MAG TPA: hypothetical protein [Bacteriophage sp.]